MSTEDKDLSLEVKRLEIVVQITREQLARAMSVAAELEALLALERGSARG
jgi:hypothetical protein